MMLAGAIPTALLAVLVDFLFGQAQYWLVPRGVNPLRNSDTARRKHEHATRQSSHRSAAVCALCSRRRRCAQTIVVGGKAFTEQQIMTAMTVAAAEGQGLHARPQGGHGQRGRARGARERPDRRLLGVHGHRARGVQQDHRQVRHGRSRVQEDQGSRRGEGHRLAQHVAGQQYLRVRDERRRSAEARHRHDERPREGGEGRRQAHVRVERRVLRASRRPARLADSVRLRVRPRQRQADGYRPRLLRR